MTPKCEGPVESIDEAIEFFDQAAERSQEELREAFDIKYVIQGVRQNPIPFATAAGGLFAIGALIVRRRQVKRRSLVKTS